MFKKLFTIPCSLFLINDLNAHAIEKSAPAGFDSLRTGIYQIQNL